MKRKTLEILLFVLIFSAFHIDERGSDVLNVVIYILFGIAFFFFFKKNKATQEFQLSFQDFFSYNAIFYFILDKKNEIIYFDHKRHKKINELLENTNELNKLLKYLNLSEEHIRMINLFLSKNENFEINANYELKNIFNNILIPHFKIVMTHDDKSKHRVLFFVEDNNKDLLKIANYHNLSFFKISHRKEIIYENDLAKKINQIDKDYIVSLVDKNFVRYDEKNNENRQNQFLYINQENNYLISIFEKILFNVIDRQAEQKFLIMISKNKERNLWNTFFAENVIPIAEMNHDFEILKINNKMNEIIRFFSKEKNNFFDFFEMQNNHRNPGQYLNNELEKEGKIVENAILKFDSNAEFVLFFQKVENSIFIYNIQHQANKNFDVSFNHSQKMQVIGNLTSGIAHDFNNLLTGMVGFCDLLLLRHSLDNESSSMLIHIKHNTVRAIELIEKLLTFSKKQMMTIAVIDIKKAMINTIDLLRRIIGENITLNIRYGDGLLLTEIDRSQFEQIIINLIVNARDAIKKNGKIDVYIDSENIKDNFYKIHQTLKIYSADNEKIKPESYIRIKIEDDGEGIDESKKASIFEPFYTTREHGSGLGLSMIYNALKHVNGYIFFTTEKGKGSTFYLFLKRYNGILEDCDLEENLKIDFSPKIKQNYKILLVEDDDSVRSFIAKALEQLSYKIISFGSSEDGLKFLHDNDEEIHLMISDIMMPKLNGYDLMNEIKKDKKYEKIKFLFISGYVDNKILQDLQSKDVKTYEFLPKPFTLKQLLQKVDDIMM